VIEEELNVVELASSKMTEARTRTSQIVPRGLIDSGGRSCLFDDLPKHLRRDAVAPDLA
jgi:hypothetical protein